MVHGLEEFRKHLQDHAGQYVLIGGTACDILMEASGADLGRTTKDLDMVLIIEALDSSFGEEFWQLINEAGYERREKATGKEQFYRFTHPSQSEYPKMIELFCRKSDRFNLRHEAGLAPIHIDDDIASLSAILLDDDYYEMLIGHRKTVEEISVAETEALILLKMKAWLDLKAKCDDGKKVDSHDINKHKNDVFRLLTIAKADARVNIGKRMQDDVREFIEKINEDKPNLKNLGIAGISLEELIDKLAGMFLQ